VLAYFLDLSFELLPVFFVAIFFSSLLDFFIADDFFVKNINSKNDFLNLLLAALFGSLVPICTCGMIPLAIKLNQKGLKWTYLIAFLTAGNANSIPAMILTATISNQLFIYRFVFSIIFGMLTAYFLKFLSKENFKLEIAGACCADSGCCAKPSFINKFIADLKELSMSFLPWIFLAILFASLIHSFLGLNSLVDFLVLPTKDNFFAPLFLIAFAFPFYFCAGADVPLAKEFLEYGVAVGSLLAFMLSAPAINLTSFIVYKKAVGIKQTLVYVMVCVLVLTLIGILLNCYGH